MIDAVAAAADRGGFATLWAGEHVVMVDRSASRYPYSDDGVIAVPAQSDWLDPMIALAFAAAASSRIGLATGALLLPEHNPVVVAKQAASLDRLSGGRLTLGVGIGWSREEFAALGVPFERRAARTAEYVAAMRTVWHDDVASFEGEFVASDSIRVNPKPLRYRNIPMVVGGNSESMNWCSSIRRPTAPTPPPTGLRHWPAAGWRRAPHNCSAIRWPSCAAAIPNTTLTTMLAIAGRSWRSSPRRWVSSIQVENVV